MDSARDIRQDEQLDWDALETYLQVHLAEAQGALEVLQFHGGHANLTYLLRYQEQEYVLRRPPFGKIAPGAHDMHREYRVLSQLHEEFAPAPRAYHYCDNTAIIGAAFVIMERKSGVVVRREIPEELAHHTDIEQRLTSAMLGALADLHQVDPRSVKLEQLGRAEGFVERQLAGWTKRWQLSKTEEVPAMEEVLRQLGQKVPTPQRESIIHNDMKLDNCQFQPEDPDQVSAVFDWDMCTLGDPLMDFATALSYWPDERFDQSMLPIKQLGNYPSKAALKSKYTNLTGLDLSDIHWYEAMAAAKGVVIAQQLYARYVSGASSDQRMAAMGPAAKFLAEVALMLFRQS